MATAPREGLNPARKVGSAPDNKALTEYDIASGYATALGTGDPVKLSSGTIVVATNGADALGSFHGCFYIASDGRPAYQKYWPAAQTSTVQPTALVLDDPAATFHVKADGTVAQVKVGNIYAMNLTAPDSATGRSTMTAKVLATSTGSTDLSGETDLGANTTFNDTDTFLVKTSAPGAANTTITINDGDGIDDLLDQLNAAPNISAELTSDGYLKISATDGYSLVLTDGTGTPLADDATLAGAAGTTTPTVAANAGLLKVVKVVDTDNDVLECVLVNHSYRDDG
jgi:hypothetical protein